MKVYTSEWEAISDLHERGFTEDFELSGDDLLWIQQKIIFQPGDFVISECHHFGYSSGQELVIYTVLSDFYFAKGILLTHHKSLTDKASAIGYRLLKPGSNLISYHYDYILSDNVAYREI